MRARAPACVVNCKCSLRKDATIAHGMPNLHACVIATVLAGVWIHACVTV
jgi:hypothetical protein